MGEAKRRGTFEQRRQQAMNNKQPQQTRIDMADMPPLICPECGCEHWKQVFLIFKLSALDPKNPTKQDQYPAIPRYACSKCGELFDENKAIAVLKSPSPN